MTPERRLSGECERLEAKFAVGDAGAANLTRDELVERYIDRKMRQFGVSDGDVRQTVTEMLRRRFGDMITCCAQVRLKVNTFHSSNDKKIFTHRP